MKRKRRAKVSAPPARAEPGAVWLGPTPPIASPNSHAILAQILARAFAEVDLGASLSDGLTWYPLHAAPNVTSFEVAQGMENKRWTYNERCLERARREGGTVIGEHAGFHDLFTVVGEKSSPWTLVAGPFAVSRPSASEVHARWREVTGEHGHASDPEFLRYVSTTLGTATLDGDKLDRFKGMVRCFGDLLHGREDIERLSAVVSETRESLADVRFVERMWVAVREMVDERTAGGWLSDGRLRTLMQMGVERLPQHVLVGLLTGRHRDADPVDDLLARDAFLRACVQMGQKRGGILCGRIADHGVILAVDERASGARLRANLHELGERALDLAKRLGLRMHVGVGADSAGLLPGRYQSALAAAEFALSQDQLLVHAEHGASPRKRPLGMLRKQLTDAVGENPTLLSPRFDRYLEVLLVHCGHRPEPIRAHLESALDQITEALRATGTVDEKSLDELQNSLDRIAVAAPTVRDLAAAYRAGIADIQLTLQSPRTARQARSLRRAMQFVRDHLAEPLSIERVAKVAGFAPRYFSKLFAETEHTTFHQYVLGLRLEQAKRTLLWTTLSVERVGQLVGFSTRSHFHRAFVAAEGSTPLEYRKRPRKAKRAVRK